MTEVFGYRTGWSGRSRLPAEGDCHVVAEGSTVALCGVECTHFDREPFLGRLAQCPDCIKALRALSIG